MPLPPTFSPARHATFNRKLRHQAGLLVRFEDQTGGTLPHLLRYTPGNGVAQPITLAAGDTEHNLTDLRWNTGYAIEITAFDDPTESSVLSTLVFTSPYTAPSITATAIGSDSISLTLDIKPADLPDSIYPGTGYSIEMDDGSTGWAEIELVAVGDQPSPAVGLNAESTYAFRVRSVNGNPSPHVPGYSGYSSTVSATTDATIVLPFSWEGIPQISPVLPFSWAGVPQISPVLPFSWAGVPQISPV